ncbi:hypothetical protein BDR22DRAFT_827981 [Usnea florida]
MPIIHVVLFNFKASLDPGIVQETCNRMVDLRNQCIHPTTKKPYITSSSGGRQNSPEGSKAGYSHAFVVEFANEEDRKYYVEEDQAHLEFKKVVRELVDKIGVVDYTPGVY